MVPVRMIVSVSSLSFCTVHVSFHLGIWETPFLPPYAIFARSALPPYYSLGPKRRGGRQSELCSHSVRGTPSKRAARKEGLYER